MFLKVKNKLKYFILKKYKQGSGLLLNGCKTCLGKTFYISFVSQCFLCL